MSEPRTIGEDAAQRWLAGARSVARGNEIEALEESEKHLAELIDRVVSEWVERGG